MASFRSVRANNLCSISSLQAAAYQVFLMKLIVPPSNCVNLSRKTLRRVQRGSLLAFRTLWQRPKSQHEDVALQLLTRSPTLDTLMPFDNSSVNLCRKWRSLRLVRTPDVSNSGANAASSSNAVRAMWRAAGFATRCAFSRWNVIHFKKLAWDSLPSRVLMTSCDGRVSPFTALKRLQKIGFQQHVVIS